jgi:hypothetical protein
MPGLGYRIDHSAPLFIDFIDIGRIDARFIRVAAFEDEADYDFQATVTSDYDPDSAIERELVFRLASVLWCLRRASGIETALFDRIFRAETDIAEGFLHLSALPTLPLDR